MKLSITSAVPCSVLVCSESTYTAGTNKTRFLLTGNHHIISLLPIGKWERHMGIELDTLSHDKQIKPETNGDVCNVIDWGADSFELVYNGPDVECGTDEIKLLSSMEIQGGRRIELFNDDGLRLNECRGTEMQSYLLASEKGWKTGEMSLLDVGRERLLIVKARNGCGETLNVLTLRLECLKNIRGEHCGVSNGYFYRIDGLRTVRGYQNRSLFLYDNGKVDKISEEIGFFTNKKHEVTKPEDIALALVQSVNLGLRAEYPLLTAKEISESISFDDLCGFFGKFEFCSVMPRSLCMDGEVVIGVYNEKKGIIVPKKFSFTITEGRISDVNEE